MPSTRPTLAVNVRLQSLQYQRWLPLPVRPLRTMLSEAREFQRWVTHEVLSTIRKHGVYATETVLQKAVDDPDFMIGELARDLRQSGVQIGQSRLFARLREHGYLIARKGESWNEPTQRALEQGLFDKTRSINKPDSTTLITRTTKVTGKGTDVSMHVPAPPISADNTSARTPSHPTRTPSDRSRRHTPAPPEYKRQAQQASSRSPGRREPPHESCPRPRTNHPHAASATAHGRARTVSARRSCSRRPNPLAQGRRRPDRGRAGIGSGFGQLRYFDSSCSGVIPHAVHSDPRSPRVHSLLSWIRSFT